MLENSIWRQYHEDNSYREKLQEVYVNYDMDLISDDGELYNELKRKLTKKELRLFAMQSAGLEDTQMRHTLGYSDEELSKAKQKLAKKFLQDKVRFAFCERGETFDATL